MERALDLASGQHSPREMVSGHRRDERPAGSLPVGSIHRTSAFGSPSVHGIENGSATTTTTVTDGNAPRERRTQEKYRHALS